MHLPQDLVGAVEAFAAGVPDLLHQILRGPVSLGGRGHLLLLGREPHPRQVLLLQGAWVKDMNVMIEDGNIVGYKVNVEITFELEE